MSKVYVGFAILLALISAIGGTYRAGYTSGRDSSIAEYEQSMREEQAKILTAMNEETKAIAAQRDSYREKIKEIEARKPKTRKVYVDKIIEINPGCPDLHGFSELWNATN